MWVQQAKKLKDSGLTSALEKKVRMKHKAHKNTNQRQMDYRKQRRESFNPKIAPWKDKIYKNRPRAEESHQSITS